ncbi:winged helix-turn-helix domain-containing protein [Haloarchaeobius iranensis]|uniref:winged helix-turn-helix domain-containing protein n=1 Tax=Haloarchaeobius iranensis TaxID=996166 RepID=UPI0036F243AB
MTDAKRRILSRLDEEPAHGYILAKELSVQGSTMYEHLEELENSGYIKSSKNGRKKVYRITKKAELVLEAERVDE